MEYNPKGCRFIVGINGTAQWCGKPGREDSSYCAEHHALCHVPVGSAAEAKEIRRIERMAKIVGGKAPVANAVLSDKFLRALDTKSRRRHL